MSEGVLTDEEIADLEALEESRLLKKPVSMDAVDPKQLMRDTRINPEQLDTGMIKQAALYSHYAVIAARSNEKLDNIKTMRDVLESKIDKEIRDAAAEDGKKVTEKMIESQIRSDPRYVKAAKMVNKARADSELAKQALESLKQKRDMMVQIGVSMREEMKGEMRLKELSGETPSSGKAISRDQAVAIAAGKG